MANQAWRAPRTLLLVKLRLLLIAQNWELIDAGRAS